MDECFKALSNVHRRRLLVNLLDHNPQRDSVDIPEDLHKGEKTVEALQTEFNHVHLPSLVEAGFIRWEREANEVLKGPRFNEIRPVLELMQNHADELPDGWV